MYFSFVCLFNFVKTEKCSLVGFVNVICNQMKYLFLRRKDEGTNIDLYIVKIHVCVSLSIYIYFPP